MKWSSRTWTSVTIPTLRWRCQWKSTAAAISSPQSRPELPKRQQSSTLSSRRRLASFDILVFPWGKTWLRVRLDWLNPFSDPLLTLSFFFFFFTLVPVQITSEDGQVQLSGAKSFEITSEHEPQELTCPPLSVTGLEFQCRARSRGYKAGSVAVVRDVDDVAGSAANFQAPGVFMSFSIDSSRNFADSLQAMCSKLSATGFQVIPMPAILRTWFNFLPRPWLTLSFWEEPRLMWSSQSTLWNGGEMRLQPRSSFRSVRSKGLCCCSFGDSF